MICENKKKKHAFCPVVATINKDIKNKLIIIAGQHNHLPQEANIQMDDLKRANGVKSTKIDSLNTSENIQNSADTNSRPTISRCASNFNNFASFESMIIFIYNKIII